MQISSATHHVDSHSGLMRKIFQPPAVCRTECFASDTRAQHERADAFRLVGERQIQGLATYRAGGGRNTQAVVLLQSDRDGSPTLPWGREAPATVWAGPPCLVGAYKVWPSRVMIAAAWRART